MPTLDVIADHWRTSPETTDLFPQLKAHGVGWGEPFCFSCGWLAPGRSGSDVWKLHGLGQWLQRAHLRDHFYGGGVEPANLVPLCHLCHEIMPDSPDRSTGASWVADGRQVVHLPHLWQAFTDGWKTPNHSGRAHVYRLKSIYLETIFAPAPA